jgi:nucleoside-specific outer membrane channel protein Tsx
MQATKLLVFLSGLLFFLPAYSIDWTSNNIQVLHGADFELGDPERTTVTVEHAHGWQYGTNFFFVDNIFRDDIGYEVYAEVYSYLSLSKISGQQVGFGPIKDVSLFAGINISNKAENDNFKAYLAGISFDLGNAWFDYLQLDIGAYKDDGISGKYGVQFTPVWSLPFSLFDLRMKFRGFADFRTGNTNNSGNFHILAQPQMLIDVGHLAGWHQDKLYIGTEYMYWYNKFGLDGVEESTVQGMIIAFF